MQYIRTLIETLEYSLPRIGFSDVVDVLVVAIVIYKIITSLRSSSAVRVAKGIVIVLVATFLTDVFNLNTLNFILTQILELGFIAVIILFQPELRRMLEHIGNVKIGQFFGFARPVQAVGFFLEGLRMGAFSL